MDVVETARLTHCGHKSGRSPRRSSLLRRRDVLSLFGRQPEGEYLRRSMMRVVIVTCGILVGIVPLDVEIGETALLALSR